MLTIARRSGPVSVMMTWTISPDRSVIGKAVSAWALSKTVRRSDAGATSARQPPSSVRPVALLKRTIRSSTGRPPSNTSTSSRAGSPGGSRSDCSALASRAIAIGASVMPAAINNGPSSMPARVTRESLMGSTAHPGAFGALLHGTAQLDGAAEKVAAGKLLQVLLAALEVARLEQRVGQRVADVLIGQQTDAGQVLLHAGGLLEPVEFQKDCQALLDLLRLIDDLCVE